MVDNDDILLGKFFDENRQTIEDNGFSRRVRHALPPKYSLANRIWITICVVIGIAFFWWVDGINAMRIALDNVFGDMFGLAVSINIGYSSLIVVGITLLTIMSVYIYNLVISD